MSDGKPFKGDYGESADGNFRVVDIITTPHPYCITARHVVLAADHFRGILGKEAMKEADRLGIRCGVKDCYLLYEDHQTALLVDCDIEMKGEDGKATPELYDYLLKCKLECENHGYAGFAFKESSKLKGGGSWYQRKDR